MTGDREEAEAAVFVVHGLDHLRAILSARTEQDRPIVALSAAGASAFAGAAWFLAMVAHARAEFPHARLTAILDCADRAGDVLSALKLGATDVVFTGNADARRRLRSIADGQGARILPARPPGVDLLDSHDSVYTARAVYERVSAAHSALPPDTTITPDDPR